MKIPMVKTQSLLKRSPNQRNKERASSFSFRLASWDRDYRKPLLKGRKSKPSSTSIQRPNSLSYKRLFLRQKINTKKALKKSSKNTSQFWLSWSPISNSKKRQLRSKRSSVNIERKTPLSRSRKEEPLNRKTKSLPGTDSPIKALPSLNRRAQPRIEKQSKESPMVSRRSQNLRDKFINLIWSLFWA